MILHTSDLRACYVRQPFGWSRLPRARPRGKDVIQARSTDELDEIELRSFLPGRHRTSKDDAISSSSAEDSLLRDRLQVLRQKHQADLAEVHETSTSHQQDDHQDVLARAQTQLQKLNPNRLPPRVRGLILLNILVLLCGANWVVLKETEDFFDPFTFAALRFSLAAAVFFPWVKNAAKDRKVLKGGLELGIYSALAYMTQSVGLITSDASRASFISTFTVSLAAMPYPCCHD